MATYETCFVEYSANSFPDWTDRWHSPTKYTYDPTGVSYGDAAMRFDAPGNRSATSWDDVGSVGDVEIIARVSCGGESFDGRCRLYARGSGTDTTETAYFTEIDAVSGDFRIYKYVNAVATQLGSDVPISGFSNTKYYWIRFEVSGTSPATVRAKIWEHGDSEPGSWDISQTDSDIASGWIGVGGYYGNYNVFDWFGVGVGETPNEPDDISGCTTVPPTTAPVTTAAPTTLAPTTPIASSSESPSESPSVSPSVSPSASESPSVSPSVSPSASESPSVSPSESPSVSPSASPSESPSVSPSPSPSASESPSVSPSASPSASESPSVSPSMSPSASESPSESLSISPSASPPEHVVPVIPMGIRCGAIEITLSTSGEQFNQCFEIDPIGVTVGIIGSVVEGIVVDAGSIDIEITLDSYGAVLGDYGDHRAKWSKIGYLDFTIDESNVAGERPMDWKGQIYDIRNLANKNPVYYGQNGVTLLKPSGVHMGMETIYRLGVKNKGATAGDERFHFFIDVLNQLWMLSTEGLVRLDYSEFISQMTTPIMSYDKEQELLYICDGTYGYIYGVRSKSFGEGPVNVTGIDSQGGTLYVTADGEVDTPKFEICTDIYDFGTRKFKTIQSIEVGSDLTEHLHASADYRVSYNDDFRQIPWFLVNPNGRAYPKCYGVEFRFRLRSFIYEYFEIDYLKVRGHIHGYSYLDTTVEKSGAAE